MLKVDSEDDLDIPANVPAQQHSSASQLFKLTMTLNWGILGTGVISHDFYSGFTNLKPEEHKLIAVAGRRLESAEKFAVEHSIEKVYDSYEELLQNAKIDIVYIGTISSTHYHWVKKCLKAGKHVLCEKPLCVNVKEAKDLVEYAKKKKLFLMDAIWSRHFPSYHQLYVKSLLERQLVISGNHIYSQEC